MKTAIYLIATCLISAGAIVVALDLQNPFPAFGLAFAVWPVFIWSYNKRSRKAADRKFRERMFQQHMRSILNNPRY